MKAKQLCIITIIWLCSISTMAFAEWNFGIGTGPTLLNVDGDLGIHTNIAGAAKFPIKLDPKDISDLTDKAFGFTSFASQDKWLFQLSMGKLDLEDSSRSGASSAEIEFDITSAEFTASYTAYQNKLMKVNVVGGLRYTRHELKADIVTAMINSKKDLDNGWVDAVTGLSIDFPFAEKWSWNNRFDVGFGGSEGTYTANTGVSWDFFEHWKGTIYYKYSAVEFEDGNRNDTDWYLYDVDESYMGLIIAYKW